MRVPTDGTGGQSSGGDSMASSMLGELLLDRYRIESVIHDTGLGTLFKGSDEESGSVVKLRLLNDEIDAASESAEKLMADIEAANAIDGFVTDVEVGLHGGRSILIAEPSGSGFSLADRLEADGALDAGSAMGIALQILATLDAYHDQERLHLALRPENILLETDVDGVITAQLADAGLHHVLGLEHARRKPSQCFARPEYLSP